MNEEFRNQFEKKAKLLIAKKTNSHILPELVVTGKDRSKSALGKVWDAIKDTDLAYLDNPSVMTAAGHTAKVSEMHKPTEAERKLGDNLAVIGLAGTAGTTAPTVLSSLTPSSTFWMNPITQNIVKGTAATTAVNTAMVGTTGKTWGEGVEELTGIPSWIGEFTNPVGGVAFSRGYNIPGVQLVFENLPYKTFEKVESVAKRTKAALNGRTDMLLLRYKASSRPIKGVQSEGTYQTTTENPVELLRKRILYKLDNAGIYEMPPKVSTIDNTPTYSYTPLRDMYKIVRENEKVLPSLFITPYAYWKINSAPGMFIRAKTPYVQLNPKIFKSYFNNVNPDIATAHELAHALWNKHQLIGFGDLDIYGFNFNSLPKKIQQYFNANEIAARGTQLKNYFGITDKTPLTGDMLKYAANNYVRDTGLNNNMNQFFRSITDWDKAARWLSSYSYKKGGKIWKKN